jgi:hypothetical protein
MMLFRIAGPHQIFSVETPAAKAPKLYLMCEFPGSKFVHPLSPYRTGLSK